MKNYKAKKSKYIGAVHLVNQTFWGGKYYPTKVLLSLIRQEVKKCH